MVKLSVLATLGALAAVVCALPVENAEEAAKTVRIMPFGASIVGAPGCWRALLWQDLQKAGVTNTDFVGSNKAPDCGFSYDGENEGHAGALADEYVKNGNLTTWLKQNPPDVIIMHLGTNDIVQKRSTASIITAYTALVGQMRTSKSSMKIIVSKLIPISPSVFGDFATQGVIALNKAMDDWAKANTKSESPITLVDNWTGFDASADTIEGEHPNASGNRKMADKFLQPTISAIRSVSTLQERDDC
ncbi:SGNH hydrolase [Polyplosphaeria fusca]|uniref:SGNH hydrolase n=1 Tax=Polyplosphaeria fusca TaxID=682080 RepID=A0A9P4R8W1_9PLEO|nr:SGNH hydrolase [Polyplosphaeria fusca]